MALIITSILITASNFLPIYISLFPSNFPAEELWDRIQFKGHKDNLQGPLLWIKVYRYIFVQGDQNKLYPNKTILLREAFTIKSLAEPHPEKLLTHWLS